MIHARSRRADGPFVVLNCADPEPGAVRGGAVRPRGRRRPAAQPRRAGVLERAHGGTLLLDEVADMPLETQGKIVRALQEQSFERRRRHDRVKVDVRVIATTNRDLQAEIAAGRFREDLFYRLSVVPLRVPSLARAARGHARAGAAFPARASAERPACRPRELGEDALAALQAYDWPGNVRQLRNVIDWLLIMAPGGRRSRSGPTCCRPRSARRRRRCCAGTGRPRSCRCRCARRASCSRREYLQAQLHALRRQYLADRDVRRHGARGAAPQAEVARRACARSGRRSEAAAASGTPL